MEWHPEFIVGRTRLQVAFTGGHLCGGAVTAASYETTDPVVQAVIERSAAYKQKRIVLAASYPDEAALKPAGSAPGGVPAEVGNPSPRGVTLEYSDLEEIRDFLQREKGVAIDDIFTDESCIDVAARLGFTLKKKTVKS